MTATSESETKLNARSTRLRVAVTQAEPGWLDLEASVKKTCSLIADAAAEGAQVLAFPECWITGYPGWIWIRPVDVNMTIDYIKNSLRVDSPEIDRICQAAAQHGLVVVLGFSERLGDSLYISQVVIDGKQQGRILSHRRKIKPTHMERTIFGDASGETLSGVVDSSIGRVGALACWEHTQPLLKYYMYSQREQIHVAAWPPLHPQQGRELWSMTKDGARTLSRTYAIEAQAFVLHAATLITEKGVTTLNTAGSLFLGTPGGGTSAIFGPDGVQLTEDLDECTEGILYADIDFDDILKAKSFLDLCGHYSRPDLLWLGVDPSVKGHVRS
ncbi:carbon-nitrogen hydrolase [Periconia macrospinosa]|uniref:nitrilase n=1 Tax=Periconia macrospinosa TaxID=97972 RepID=A0A2V1DVB3_9PLEO|nr:carbon-nitrogen hydrolase [Periconia macrospinosa]